MNKLYNPDYIKYLIILGILYALLKIIPNPKLQQKDIILILVIVVFSIYCVNYKKIIIDNFDNNMTIPIVMSKELETKIEKISNAMPHKTIPQVMHNPLNAHHQTKDAIEKKYYNILLNNLINKKVLNSTDVSNIDIKLNSKLFTLEDVITSLEQINNSTKINTTHQNNMTNMNNMNTNDNSTDNSTDNSKQINNDNSKQVNNDNIYNELLPTKMMSLGDQVPSTWSSNYTILNTDKWKVPMTQPPVCINTTPCKVCPDDENAYPYLGLQNWDAGRKISNTNINNKWTQNQTDSSN